MAQTVWQETKYPFEEPETWPTATLWGIVGILQTKRFSVIFGGFLKVFNQVGEMVGNLLFADQPALVSGELQDEQLILGIAQFCPHEYVEPPPFLRLIRESQEGQISHWQIKGAVKLGQTIGATGWARICEAIPNANGLVVNIGRTIYSNTGFLGKWMIAQPLKMMSVDPNYPIKGIVGWTEISGERCHRLLNSQRIVMATGGFLLDTDSQKGVLLDMLGASVIDSQAPKGINSAHLVKSSGGKAVNLWKLYSLYHIRWNPHCNLPPIHLQMQRRLDQNLEIWQGQYRILHDPKQFDPTGQIKLIIF